jgi:hypothetical protein
LNCRSSIVYVQYLMLSRSLRNRFIATLSEDRGEGRGKCAAFFSYEHFSDMFQCLLVFLHTARLTQIHLRLLLLFLDNFRSDFAHTQNTETC